MTADGQGSEAASAYWPNGDQGQQQPVAVLDFALLMTVAGWQREGCVHKLDTVVERLHRGNEPIESVLGPSQTLQARFDRSQPSPVSRRGNQARGEVEVGDSNGDRGRLYLRTEMLDEGAHSLRRDALGRSRREVASIVRLQESHRR
jgi:hypothetical protein